MIVNTEYQSNEGRGLVNYIQNDNGKEVEVRTPDGSRATTEDMEEWIKKTEEHEFSRGFTITPTNMVGWNHEELDKKTREFMSEVREDRPNLDYVYAIHDTEASDTTHVHVATAGPVDESGQYFGRNDTAELTPTASEVFEEEQKLQTEEIIREFDSTKEQLPEWEIDNGVIEYEEEIDMERQQGLDHDRGLGR